MMPARKLCPFDPLIYQVFAQIAGTVFDNDEVYPFQLRALSLCNLLREPKQPAAVEGEHVQPLDVRVPMINKWLDETSGPVKFI